MTEPPSYQPCLTRATDTCQRRWETLREFVRRWHGIPLAPVDPESTLVAKEELRLGIVLPPSLRQWLSFADELLKQDAFGILRDSYDVRRLQTQQATSLMLQCEGDVYWAVRDESLSLQDPPVDLYHRPDEGAEFGHVHSCAPHLTGFVLEHMSHFLRGQGGGFMVDIEPTPLFLDAMSASFTSCGNFGHLRIFESENILAMIIADQVEPRLHRLRVEVWRPMSMNDVPRCVVARAKNGGSFHGMFARQR